MKKCWTGIEISVLKNANTATDESVLEVIKRFGVRRTYEKCLELDLKIAMDMKATIDEQIRKGAKKSHGLLKEIDRKLDLILRDLNISVHNPPNYLPNSGMRLPGDRK